SATTNGPRIFNSCYSQNPLDLPLRERIAPADDAHPSPRLMQLQDADDVAVSNATAHTGACATNPVAHRAQTHGLLAATLRCPRPHVVRVILAQARHVLRVLPVPAPGRLRRYGDHVALRDQSVLKRHGALQRQNITSPLRLRPQQLV